MSYDVYGPFLPLVMLITFLGLFIWVLLPQNKKSFDDAANLPFADDEQEADNNKSNEPAHDRREEK
ncbi:cbb3-type cytochrome oxidase subunit 3 [Nitrincola alkalilacustris]|uniref:cbb3-type cytochrome oxidase subunit 3 n=1 Tax=Nitrincola alkalilacustris TaxID=1571224 RepID=UPI00197CFAE0|nr:cbb3-type cytochrome c oxidase subunit 3 [Nitrincola alkalilacustris]